MSDRHTLPPDATLRVSTSSGDVTIIAEDRSDVEVPDESHVELRTPESREPPREEGREEGRGRRRGRKHKALRLLRMLTGVDIAGHLGGAPKPEGPTLEVRSSRGGSRDITVRCPAGSAVAVGTMSGDIRLVGDFGAATVTSMSGDIYVERAEAVDARSVSGDLEVTTCRGACRLNTKSGRIEAGETGPVQAFTISGHVRVEQSSGRAKVHTVSGNVALGTDGADAVSVRTVSGSVEVNVPDGKAPDAKLRSLSGRTRCDCPQGEDFRLEVSTVSGGIEVKPS